MSKREIIAAGLKRTGGLSLLERVSRSYEMRFDSGSRWPHFSRVSSGKFVILCYHRIGTGGIPYYSELSAAAFDAQMAFLRKHYRVVSLEKLLGEMNDPSSKGQAVAVTFDDGYRGLFTEALPILKEHQIPAMVYLLAGAIESGEPAWYDRIFLALQQVPGASFEIELDTLHRFDLPTHQSRVNAAASIVAELRKMPDARRRECCAALDKRVPLPSDALANRMLSWDQVRQMQKAGISFGAHTMTHPVVSRLQPLDAQRELTESKRLIEERLQTEIPDFAFPFGHAADCGPGAAELVARCGFRSGATTTRGANRSGGDRLSLLRAQIGEEGSLALFAFYMIQLFLCHDESADAASQPASGRATPPPDVREHEEVRAS
jgi:peptidoglycan/xylan/chitin deacetylase (PgdA/CDA1 family)